MRAGVACSSSITPQPPSIVTLSSPLDQPFFYQYPNPNQETGNALVILLESLSDGSDAGLPLDNATKKLLIQSQSGFTESPAG
ncbi:hypothetical protein EVAR_25404_1 [Eumeta japonica]|uniref:Uncharacterized protein n=1 Tax=Eumeta variegata TaxID=151549 RepID=A0A4C1V4Q9_EUMVA|nr:hypothetical protein EVAR_25404_1 [Eumeta japonica]